MSGKVVHFEIPFDDGERALAFYRDIFGWDIQSMPDMAYNMVSTGPGGDTGPTDPGYIGGGMLQRQDPVASTVVVIDVVDIDATLGDIEAKGGSTVRPKEPVGDMGFAAYFSDTEGNLVGLWQTAAG
jgi:uncharacterized protein